MIRTKTRLIAILLLCAAIAPAFGNDIEYTITDLGTLGGPTSVPEAISQNGIICGAAQLSPAINHPFVYQGSGPMQDLGLLDPVNGVVGVAYSVNSLGEVVGLSDAPGPNASHAFYYSGSGTLQDLGTFGGPGSVAFCINESGQIAGVAQTASGANHGAIWTVGGPTLDLGAGFLADAINNTGLIGGLSPQTHHAALYNLSSASTTDLGTLSGGTESQVNGLSDTGFAVGFSETMVGKTGTTHAFLYDVQTGVMTDLGNPASAVWASDALGVNDLGDVVGGYSLDATGAGNDAFIYTQAGGMQNLNDLVDPSAGWDLNAAEGVNDSGDIVGCGFNPQGQFHGFLLTPVPEPSTLQLSIVLSAIFASIAARRLSRARRRTQLADPFNHYIR
jgi:probable HAF family extracellular repeat protein